MDRELAANCNVHLPGAEATGKVSRHFPGTGGYGYKRIRVDSAGTRTLERGSEVLDIYGIALRTIYVDRLAGKVYSVGQASVSGWIKYFCTYEIDREGGPRGEPIIEAPMVQDGVGNSVAAKIRKVVGECGREVVTDIEPTISPIVAVEKVRRPVVQAMGPRVGRQRSQSPCQFSMELNLQGIEVRGQSVLDDNELPEPWGQDRIRRALNLILLQER